MVSTKRKRDYTDSAIVDMSSSSLDAEPFQSGLSSSPTGGLRDLSHRQENECGNTARGSQITNLSDFYTGDYGTAASIRSRRQTQFQAPVKLVDLPPPSTKRPRANIKSVTAEFKLLLPVQSLWTHPGGRHARNVLLAKQKLGIYWSIQKTLLAAHCRRQDWIQVKA